MVIDSFHTEATTTPNALIDGEVKNAAWPAMAQDLLVRIRTELDKKFRSTYKEVWFKR